MDGILNQIANLGFLILFTIYFLIRIEYKSEKLQDKKRTIEDN